MPSTSPAPPEPPPGARSARAFLLALALLLLLVEALLAASARPADHATIQGPQAVRSLLADLARVSAEGQAPATEQWLMLGDSVLVGDTGAAQLPNWQSQRLIDHLRGELSSDEDVRFEQIALDGMIPADMLALVEALDLADPAGQTSLLIELSPRHFSPHYAKDAGLSRPWLTELASKPWSLPRLIDQAARVAPIYRHRARFRSLREALTPPVERARTEARARAQDQSDARLAAFARLSVHYRKSVLSSRSVQVEALLAIVERCRASGRKVVFFTTPLEDEFAARLRSERQWGKLVAKLDRLLDPDGQTVVLLPMDHPMFASGMFWDHVHLRPEGHRLLALNLLAQIGLRLERAPSAGELIARPGFDTSLVARIRAGTSEGPAWQARFRRPRAIALAPGGRRLVVADTENHVLRELHGDMRIVSTLTGAPRKPGSRDGRRGKARLRSPRALTFVGHDLYIADQDGVALRRLAEGKLETLTTEIEGGRQIRAMRALPHGRGLLTLEAGPRDSRIVARSVEGAVEAVWVGGADERQLSAFTLGPEGELYVASIDGTIRRLASETMSEQPTLDQAEIVFANAPGAEVIPQRNPKANYPRPFAEIRLTEVVDLVYVEPYGGLLVQDYAPHPKRGAHNKSITERAHLRFLDLERELIFPWVKPMVVGFGYGYANTGTGGMVSPFHEGAMALDPATRALYYLERARSRLIRIEDGLFGLSKVSAYSTPVHDFDSLIGTDTGQKALEYYAPPVPPSPQLRGTYELLVVGASTTSMSQTMGEYSLARILIGRIEHELLLRDRVRVHGFQRTMAGGPLAKLIKRVESFEAAGGRPDIILVEVNGSLFLTKKQDEIEERELLDRLLELAERHDSKLVLFDTTPYIVHNREPLHPGPRRMRDFLARVEAQGLTVVRVADLVLDDYLELAPFASPPATHLHQPPWAIDATADALGDALVPIVRAALREREPARERTGPRGPQADSAGKRLAEAFGGAEFDWDTRLPALPASAVQYANEGDELHAFIDLGAVPDERVEDLDALVLALVYERSVRFSDGARHATITLARFAAYDEYGAGVEQDATIIAREELDYTRLVELVERSLARSP